MFMNPLMIIPEGNKGAKIELKLPLGAYCDGDFKFPTGGERCEGRLQLPSGSCFKILGQVLSVDTLLRGDAKLESWELDLLLRLYEFDRRSIDVVDRVEDAETNVPSYVMKGVLNLKDIIVENMQCSFEELRYYFGCNIDQFGGKMNAKQVLTGVKLLSAGEVRRAFMPCGLFFGEPMVMHMLAHEHANEYLEAFQLLCEREGAKWYDSIDGEGLTFLHYAAKNREHGAFLVHHLVDCDLEACDNKGLTPLVTAIRCGNLETVKALHELGANLTFVPPPCPRSCCAKTVSPKTPLEEAIVNKNCGPNTRAEIVEYLLSTDEVGNLEQKHLDLVAETNSSRISEVVQAAYEKQQAEIGPLRPGTQELIEQCRQSKERKERKEQKKRSRAAASSSSSTSSLTVQQRHDVGKEVISSFLSEKKGTKRSAASKTTNNNNKRSRK